MLNFHERLLFVRTLSHVSVMVRQTNEQVKLAVFIRPGLAPAAETVRLKSFRPILAGQ